MPKIMDKNFNPTKYLVGNNFGNTNIYGVPQEKKERIPLKKSAKDEIFLKNQKGRCARCGVNMVEKGIIPPDFHHKDGNCSNNKTTNIEAICPNCHRKETFKQWRARDNQKKKPKQSTNPYGVPNYKQPKNAFW